MAVMNQLISVYRGEHVPLGFTMSPVENISGWTFLLSVAPGPYTTKTFTVAGDIVVAADGTFAFTMDADVTAPLLGEYVYDVWKTNANAERLLAEGPFRVLNVVRLP